MNLQGNPKPYTPKPLNPKELLKEPYNPLIYN